MKNGIVYIAFGDKAREEVQRSYESIRDVGVDLPVMAIGDRSVSGLAFTTWDGAPPFHGTGPMSFRAGEVKPFLLSLSPFKNTLYLDADTTMVKDFTEGFENLKYYDICVSYHVKRTGEEWYVDEIFGDPQSVPVCPTSIMEREKTQDIIGARMPFINTGVIFFRDSEPTREFFDRWYREWKVFREWDEQMAFHRAIARTDGLKVLLLPPKWNQKYPDENTIILHGMGKGTAREGKK